MPRIAVDVYAFVEDLLTEFSLATGRGEWTTPFFGTASVKTKSEESEQVGDCLRFENRGIDTGFQHTRIACVERFANCFVSDTSGVEFCNVEVISEEISRAGSIGSSCGHR